MTRARLTVVTGKGGVGRSTIAAGLARLESSLGHRVLAIDASAGNGLAAALGRPLEPGVTTPVPLDDGGRTDGTLHALKLTTEAALDEYVRMTLRSPISPRSLGPVARIFDYVATAAPAVREILTIGKIGHEVRRGPWDVVIVDGPATGHVVEMLDAPSALGELVGIGPLAAESAWLTELLADDESTSVWVVATPEELPVNEAVELADRIDRVTPCTVDRIVANRLPARPGPDAESEVEALLASEAPGARLAVAALTRARRADTELDRLAGIGPDVLRVAESSDPVGAARAAMATGAASADGAGDDESPTGLAS
ncbi:MAG: ArsA-related P-loop ATPase [Actinomycetota bacterium]